MNFNNRIIETLKNHFGENSEFVLEHSSLLLYLQKKMISANRGATSRGSFANIYAIYALVDNYITNGFDKKSREEYSNYCGVEYNMLSQTIRQLPFGSKLQNHALNNRLNGEFAKYFPSTSIVPIVRDLELKRYWIQQDLLWTILPDGKTVNIAQAVLDIINDYIKIKTEASKEFVTTCTRLSQLDKRNLTEAYSFIVQQLNTNTDARIFEIVSYSILKHYYNQEIVWIGKTKQSVQPETLQLFKTGRTNANDGGIDFVLKPLGRFFQVTQTLDINKYFLDIDKVQHFPITFVVKSDLSVENIREEIKRFAIKKFNIHTVIESYMNSIEEIINLQRLQQILQQMLRDELKLKDILSEILLQYKLEFNNSPTK